MAGRLVAADLLETDRENSRENARDDRDQPPTVMTRIPSMTEKSDMDPRTRKREKLLPTAPMGPWGFGALARVPRC